MAMVLVLVLVLALAEEATVTTTTDKEGNSEAVFRTDGTSVWAPIIMMVGITIGVLGPDLDPVLLGSALELPITVKMLGSVMDGLALHRLVEVVAEVAEGVEVDMVLALLVPVAMGMVVVLEAMGTVVDMDHLVAMGMVVDLDHQVVMATVLPKTLGFTDGVVLHNPVTVVLHNLVVQDWGPSRMRQTHKAHVVKAARFHNLLIFYIYCLCYH